MQKAITPFLCAVLRCGHKRASLDLENLFDVWHSKQISTWASFVYTAHDLTNFRSERINYFVNLEKCTKQ
jgi:hypothetical protein